MSAAEIIDTAVSEEMTIHPAAEAFRLHTDEELQGLVESIKKIGLNHPIMLTSDGRQLVDGRNRLRACELAGVDPRYDWLPQGVDPRDYVVGENINRRDITKGQKALALALIYPDRGKHGRGHKDPAMEKLPTVGSFGREMLRLARTIAKHPDLADMVKVGTMKFDYALEEAQRRTRVEDNSAHYMAELTSHAPDLATQVADEHLTLQEAWMVYESRKKEAELVEQNRRETYLRILEGSLHAAVATANADFVQGLQDRLAIPDFEAQVHKRLRLGEIDRGETRAAMVNGIKSLTAILQALL